MVPGNPELGHDQTRSFAKRASKFNDIVWDLGRQRPGKPLIDPVLRDAHPHYVSNASP